MKMKDPAGASKVALTPQTSRSKHASSRTERMRAALTAKDPWISDCIEADFCRKYVGKSLIKADKQVEALRNARHARLTPLRATELFAELYWSMWEYKKDSGCTASCKWNGDFSEASTAVIKDLWKARQQADAFGMDYYNYIAGMFKKHLDLYGCRPLPSEMHGLGAMAAFVDVE